MPLAKVEEKMASDERMLEYLSGQIQNQIPGTEIKRQDVTNLGNTFVGMLAVRYQLGLDSILKQEAIIPPTPMTRRAFLRKAEARERITSSI